MNLKDHMTSRNSTGISLVVGNSASILVAELPATLTSTTNTWTYSTGTGTSIDMDGTYFYYSGIGSGVLAGKAQRSNGSATVTVSGGTSPYIYQWSSGDMDSTATGLTAGTYTVTVTDADGCVQTDTVEVPLLTGIAEGVLRQGLFHPNPADERLVFRSAENGDRACLFSVTGAETACTILTSGDGNMDISTLPTGVYVAVLERNGRVIGRQRAVVQR